MNQPLTALLLGAGDRGANAYGRFALENPQELRFVAVAETQPERRKQFAANHHIPEERCFPSWKQALAAGKIADVVINATQDATHYPSGMAALEAGYDMLLEKPIAPNLADAVALTLTAERLGRKLMIGHVLRYTEFFEALGEVIQSGALGQLVTLSWRENVGAYHMAHSYVRGNWRSTRDSAPMLLAKCCHDLDLLTWYLREPITSLASTGSLLHFRPENAPAGAPARCTDGCLAALECPFYAPAIYRDMLPIKYTLLHSEHPSIRWLGKAVLRAPGSIPTLDKLLPGQPLSRALHAWPRSVITNDPKSDEAVMQALLEGPYGRCVYHCDNDVVDHQVVLMSTQSGVSVSLTMHGHSYEEGRTIRMDGSKATLLGKFSHAVCYLELWDQRGFLLWRKSFATELDRKQSGHGGGDAGLARAFIRMLRGEPDALTSGRSALESHILAFAAEEARLTKQTVSLETFKQNWGLQ